MAEVVHLARRFFGALLPVGPGPDDATWAEGRLLPAEVNLWHRMSPADRRHAVGVARRVEQSLGPDVGRPVLAAALLHDVGKVVSGIGTFRRVVATLVMRSVGRDRAVTWTGTRGFRRRVVATLMMRSVGRDRAVTWTGTRGFRRRVGLYADHPQLGADLLGRAHSDPLTVTWALEHHLPRERWTTSLAIADALKAADDD